MDNLDIPDGEDEEESVGKNLDDSSDRELMEKQNPSTAKKNKESEELGGKPLKTDRTAT